MVELIAQGLEPHQRWRRSLPQDACITAGRSAGKWSVAWDEHISRLHFELCWNGQLLTLSKRPEASNPVYVRGKAIDQVQLEPGDHFVVGKTTFTVVQAEVNVSRNVVQPVTERSFSPDFLQTLPFRKPDQRIDVLSRLPAVVASDTNEHDLFVSLVNLLMEGVDRASAAALVSMSPVNGDISVLHWDASSEAIAEFTPSAKLIQRAVESGESIVHVWDANRDKGAAFTQVSEADWAFCTPVAGAQCRGWAIYITGKRTGGDSEPRTLRAEDFQDDLKFAELLAATLGGLRDVRRANRMNQFFSPVVVDAIAGQDPDAVLTPREAEVAVLFCDLRGFSQRSEQHADDLMGLLHRVSDAMGVMTHAILENGGVVGDFHGDAAMGFWGWPVNQEDAAQRACLAALDIRRQFAKASSQPGHPLADFRVGVGIAKGRAVAGKIGTTDQVKVTVFGPVVNLASRLEGMTKQIRAPILIDEQTAAEVRQSMDTDQARLRRVAVVRPRGLANSLSICELLPPVEEFPELQQKDILAYESALDSLLERDWVRAFEYLHEVPPIDRVKDFLTVFIAQHRRTPPADWDGVIPLDG